MKITGTIKGTLTLKEIQEFGRLKTPIIENLDYNKFWKIEIKHLIENALSDGSPLVDYVVLELFAKDYLIPNKNFFNCFIKNDVKNFGNEVLNRFHSYAKDFT